MTDQIPDKVRLYATELVTEASKDLVSAMKALVSPLEDRVRIVEDWRNQELGARQQDMRTLKIIGVIIGLSQVAIALVMALSK